MSWDPEKYRHKRERVLARRSVHPGLRHLLIAAALLTVATVAATTLPEVVSSVRNRHLTDAYFRADGDHPWDPVLIAGLRQAPGVRSATVDQGNGRLNVTFDARAIDAGKITTLLSGESGSVILLNTVEHGRHR